MQLRSIGRGAGEKKSKEERKINASKRGKTSVFGLKTLYIFTMIALGKNISMIEMHISLIHSKR